MDLPAEVDSGLTVEVRATVRPPGLLPHLLARARLIAASDAQDAEIFFASTMAVRYTLPWATIEATQSFVRLQIEGPDRYEAAMDLIQALTVARSKDDKDQVAIDHVRSIALTMHSHYPTNALSHGDREAMLGFLVNSEFAEALGAAALSTMQVDITVDGSSADLIQLNLEPRANDENFSASARFVWDRSGDHSDETPLLRAQKEWSNVLGSGTEAIRTAVEQLIG